jgi:hypothetical protein
METPEADRSNYDALRAAHERAMDELYRSIEEEAGRKTDGTPSREPNLGPEVAAPDPSIEGGYHRNYGVLRDDHERAMDELYRGIEEEADRKTDGTPGREADLSPEVAAPDPPIEGGYRKNYGVLRDEHARQVDELYQNIEETREPTRPQRSPGWTSRGGMVQQQESAIEWVKASSQRRAALEEIQREHNEQEPEVAPDQTPKRDDDIER